MFTNSKNAGHKSESGAIKPRSLRVSYTSALESALFEALNFVMYKLNLTSVSPPDLLLASKGVPVKLLDANGDSLDLLLTPLTESQDIKHIIFHTDDCLRDYHKYILAGIEFVSRPEYRVAGLQVNFLGYGDQLYTLLEERNYSEN